MNLLFQSRRGHRPDPATQAGLRADWPGEKLYLICDNYSVHKRAEVRVWCADNDVELVSLQTYSCWLNRIECEFAALRYFALNGTDHRSHAEKNVAIGDYIRWRNQRAGTYPRLRCRLEDPAAKLSTQRCLTRH
ncbi:transposase [Nocardia sp. NPDC127606]|uniref:transposase n=1 Tax=Nocardia sp. NPDC127606 TaxID=3345406 RepID=UPI00363D641D